MLIWVLASLQTATFDRERDQITQPLLQDEAFLYQTADVCEKLESLALSYSLSLSSRCEKQGIVW